MLFRAVAAAIALGVFWSFTLPAAADIPARERKLYEQVFAAARKDRFAEAERLAMQASDRLLPKLIRWMTYANPRSGASFEEITSFIDSSADWPVQEA